MKLLRGVDLTNMEQIVLLGLLSRVLEGHTVRKDTLTQLEIAILEDMLNDFLDEIKMINR